MPDDTLRSTDRGASTTVPLATRRARRPVLRFAFALLAPFAAFQFVFVRWISPSAWFERYLELNARVASTVLKALGFDAARAGTLVDVDGVSLEIGAACAGLQPIAVFVLAVLAYPAPLRAKLRGAAIGTLVLLFANQARILMLSLLRVRAVRAFDLVHLYLWPMAFILLTISLWVVWARRVGARE